MKRYLIILYLIAFVVLSALSDALYNDGVKVWAHSLEVIWKGMLVFSIPIFKPAKWWIFIIALVCWNIIGFDYFYNLFAGLEWDYIGSTSLWDKFHKMYPGVGLIWLRGIVLALVVSLHVKYLK